MKKSMLFYMMAAMLLLGTACSKDDEPLTEDPITSNPAFSGINKVNLTINGTTQELVFADDPIVGNMEFAAMGTKETENNEVYTEIDLAATNHFDHVTNAAMIISFMGAQTGTQDISYGLEAGFNNFSGSTLMLISDTASMASIYFLDEATANITNYGEVGGYIEGTFESTAVSLTGIPQPNISISGNFKVKRYSDGQ